MLQIPFLNSFIQKTVKLQPVADNVDCLNYYATTTLLAFFSLAISAKQFFGSPIQCWVPNEFKGGWETYAEEYCFIANSYHIPFDEDIPRHGSVERQDHISYYRWVPIVLALQAIGFWLPNYIWTVLHPKTTISPNEFLREAAKVKKLHGEERTKELEGLAKFFMDHIAFRPAGYKNKLANHRPGMNATVLYLLTKALYVANIFCQIALLNKFLGEDFLHWGYTMAADIVQGNDMKESEVFPRVIMCDFEIRRLANRQNHTVQCVIMLNMINEKLYLFLYFWFVFLTVLNVANFFYYLIMLMFPIFRTRLVMDKIDQRKYRRHRVAQFTRECLHPDGVLLLEFLKEHAGGRIAFELTNTLLVGYKGTESYSDESIEQSSILEKYPPLHYQKENYHVSVANKGFEAPTSLDYNKKLSPGGSIPSDF